MRDASLILPTQGPGHRARLGEVAGINTEGSACREAGDTDNIDCRQQLESEIPRGIYDKVWKGKRGSAELG